MKKNNFAIVPNEVFQDRRLSLIQTRILMGLLSFSDGTMKKVFPSRKQLSARTGYTETVISRATTRLVSLGWLKKEGLGGYSKACQYHVLVPTTLTELVTVDKQTTVTESVTVVKQTTVTDLGMGGCPNWTLNGDRTGHSTVTDPVTGKEQTKNRPRTDHITDQVVATKKKRKKSASTQELILKSEKTLTSSVTDVKNKKITSTTHAWRTYAAAYTKKYSVKPLSNQKTMGQMKRIAEAMPLDAIEGVINNYLANNSPFYVRGLHPVDLLLRDVGKLHTEWRRGWNVTTEAVKQAEQGDNLRERINEANRISQHWKRQGVMA